MSTKAIGSNRRISKDILRRDFEKFKKEYPNVNIGALCQDNGYAKSHMRMVMLETKSDTVNETVADNFRKLIEIGKSNPEKYPKYYRPKPIYAMYDNSTDELVIMGTIDEIAEYRGIKPQNVKMMMYPSVMKKVKNPRFTLIKVDDD